MGLSASSGGFSILVVIDVLMKDWHLPNPPNQVSVTGITQFNLFKGIRGNSGKIAVLVVSHGNIYADVYDSVSVKW